MAGANPAWIARQLGHETAKMIFEVYSKWIDLEDKSREKQARRSYLFPNCFQEERPSRQAADLLM
jgi:integrase